MLQLAEVVDKRLKNWIEEWMDFPNTMVDRITPATEQDHKSILAKDHRILDRVSDLNSSSEERERVIR